MESENIIICANFLANPTIHPITGRRLMLNKAPYLSLVQLCKDNGFDVSILTGEPIISKPLKREYNY